MMDTEFLRYLATLGVGGVLAGFIFWFYRKDAAEHTKAWQGQSEVLIRVVQENTVAITALQQTTASLTSVTAALQQSIDRGWR